MDSAVTEGCCGPGGGLGTRSLWGQARRLGVSRRYGTAASSRGGAGEADAAAAP